MYYNRSRRHFFTSVLFTFSITEFTRSLFGHLSQRDSFLQDILCDQPVFVPQEGLFVTSNESRRNPVEREMKHYVPDNGQPLLFRKEKQDLAQNGNHKIIFGANLPAVMFFAF